MKRLLAAMLMTLAGPGLAQADWPSPIAMSWEIGSAEECTAELGDFAALCAEFEDPQWGEAWEVPFWARGGLRVAVLDLDRDDAPDLILNIRHPGYCGSGGCTYAFVFGGQAIPPLDLILGIVSREPPALVESGLQFGPEGAVWEIAKLKSAALDRADQQ